MQTTTEDSNHIRTENSTEASNNIKTEDQPM